MYWVPWKVASWIKIFQCRLNKIKYHIPNTKEYSASKQSNSKENSVSSELKAEIINVNVREDLFYSQSSRLHLREACDTKRQVNYEVEETNILHKAECVLLLWSDIALKTH